MKFMICPKCETENKEGSVYCKICGESLVKETAAVNALPIAENGLTAEKKEDGAAAPAKDEKKVQAAPENEERFEEDIRAKTSPLAVRMQEKIDRADKKVIKKLKRAKMWAAIAVIMTVLFIAENAFIISYELGYLDDYFKAEEPEAELPEEPLTVPEPEKTGTDRYYGAWSYSYSLVKYHDADLSGSYAVKTEEIASSGMAVITDTGDKHIALTVIPDSMTVDGAQETIGSTPEAFYGWLDGENIAVQMKGTEQKFFAPGGAEPIVLNMAVTEGEPLSALFETTYEKTVGEMNMRYVLTVNFTKTAE